MNKLVALLCIAFANVLLPGQTLSPREAAAPGTTPLAHRAEQVSKRFPPELIVPVTAPGTATWLRSYCIYPSLNTGSLSVKPCRTNSLKLRLVPSLENSVPPAKPATLPDNVR